MAKWHRVQTYESEVGITHSRCIVSLLRGELNPHKITFFCYRLVRQLATFFFFRSLFDSFSCLSRGCQIFLGTTYQKGKNVPNGHKIYQMAIKYLKWTLNVRNGHKIYQHCPFPRSQTFTLIGIFVMKIYHLATLASPRKRSRPTHVIYHFVGYCSIVRHN
jgi:hypothetical protein